MIFAGVHRDFRENRDHKDHRVKSAREDRLDRRDQQVQTASLERTASGEFAVHRVQEDLADPLVYVANPDKTVWLRVELSGPNSIHFCP